MNNTSPQPWGGVSEAKSYTDSKVTNLQSQIDNKIDWIRNVIDLTSSTYDQNTWYPVITGVKHYGKVHVSVTLNSGSVPSWSTHSNGFSVDFAFMMQQGGWGTTAGTITMLYDNFRFSDVSPVSVMQNTMASHIILYLRGGGKYPVFSDWNATWTIHQNGYTWQSGNYSYSAPVKSSRPTPPCQTNLEKLVNSQHPNYSISGTTLTITF